MNFQKIPQLKRSHYQITIPLKSLQRTLDGYEQDQLEAGDTFELNPEFQRGHVWTESQQIAYVEWLLRGGDSGLDIYFNHTGWDNSYHGDMVCVDGLQRLTACLAFLDNTIPAFDCYYDDFDGVLRDMSTYLTFHIGSFNEKEVLEWYLEMNSGGTPHTEQELDKVRDMLDNY